jgi:hypothetical protein
MGRGSVAVRPFNITSVRPTALDRIFDQPYAVQWRPYG